jgi:hypothetical protein
MESLTQILELISEKRFCCDVSNLFRRSYVLSGDQLFGHVSAEMMVLDGDVFGVQLQLWELS